MSMVNKGENIGSIPHVSPSEAAEREDRTLARGDGYEAERERQRNPSRMQGASPETLSAFQKALQKASGSKKETQHAEKDSFVGKGEEEEGDGVFHQEASSDQGDTSSSDREGSEKQQSGGMAFSSVPGNVPLVSGLPKEGSTATLSVRIQEVVTTILERVEKVIKSEIALPSGTPIKMNIYLEEGGREHAHVHKIQLSFSSTSLDIILVNPVGGFAAEIVLASQSLIQRLQDRFPNRTVRLRAVDDQGAVLSDVTPVDSVTVSAQAPGSIFDVFSRPGTET